MFSFGKNKKQARAIKDAERSAKVSESQNRLLAAAIATADSAQEVTSLLKGKLDEIVEQFNHTARILQDGLIICDAAGTIQFFNPAAETLFGASYKDALKTSIHRFFTGVDGPLANTAELWVKLQNEDEEDVLGVHLDGTTFPARVGFSMLARHGGSNAVLLLVRNATECGPCHEASRYAAIFETTFDGIVVAKNGVIVAANPACGRLFGYGADALMGQPISKLAVERERDRFLATVTDGSADGQNCMVEGVQENGRLLSLIFTVTEVEWDGDVASLVTLRDITEMKRLEKLVAMKRDNGVDMICAFDSNYRITFANQTFANSYGERVKDLLGTDVRELVEDAGDFESIISALDLQTPSIRSFVKKDDTFQDWIDHAIFDEAGRPIEYQRVGRMMCPSLAEVIKNA